MSWSAPLEYFFSISLYAYIFSDYEATAASSSSFVGSGSSFFKVLSSPTYMFFSALDSRFSRYYWCTISSIALNLASSSFFRCRIYFAWILNYSWLSSSGVLIFFYLLSLECENASPRDAGRLLTGLIRLFGVSPTLVFIIGLESSSSIAFYVVSKEFYYVWHFRISS